MAAQEIFTDEGLDAILTIIPKGNSNAAPYQTLYLGLFTSQTGSTVPASTATGGASPTGWTEASGTAYARNALTAGTWGAAAAGTGGRKTTYPGSTMATVGATPWGTANGIVICTASASGGGDKALMFANFNDETPIATATNDIIKITPTWQFNN